MPWRIQFQTLPRSSQKGTKNRGECHIESLQLHLLAARAPLVHWGVTECSRILRWPGELLCFQFTVRLNLQRLTRLIYCVADRARKAHRKSWMHFSPFKQNTQCGICKKPSAARRFIAGLEAEKGCNEHWIPQPGQESSRPIIVFYDVDQCW